tara:strand:- start:42363 stop:43268 length:906 start_codon:yes stop_codon:yes gene_type:complete
MFRFNSISEFHSFCKLGAPKHPLVSLIDYSKVEYPINDNELKWIQNFYSIGLKRNINAKFNYGQQEYDFDNGVLTFVAPNQFLKLEINPEIKVEPTGYLLLIHQDFIWNTALAKKKIDYDFFDYKVNEALFLSEKEEKIIVKIFKNIQEEYSSNIDKFSQNIIIAHFELLLNYCDRFYQRQFITRRKTNHQLLETFETTLNNYFNEDDLMSNGLPTAKYLANSLNISPNYLGSLLKNITGQTTQNHIHNKLIEKAKEKLSITELTVAEIAFQLGFEHPQSFNKLFKSKTNTSPLEFRNSFN